MRMVEYMIFVRKRRWDLILSGGMRVKLPMSGIEKALETLSFLLQKDHIMTAKTIDLRLANDVIIAGLSQRYDSL
jgi:cell division septal protein FtsQ